MPDTFQSLLSLGDLCQRGIEEDVPGLKLADAINRRKSRQQLNSTAAEDGSQTAQEVFKVKD